MLKKIQYIAILLNSVFILLCLNIVFTEKYLEGELTKFTPEHGHAYITKLHYSPDNMFDYLLYSEKLYYNEDVIQIWQNEKLLTKKNEFHDNIRKFGDGMYSIWGENLYISSIGNIKIDDSVKFNFKLKLKHTPLLYFITTFLFIFLTFLLISLKTNFKSAFEAIFLQNLLKSYTCQQQTIIFVITFLSVVVYTLFPITLDGNFQWQLSRDSGSYLAHKYDSPWKSARSPGYRMFVDVMTGDAIPTGKDYHNKPSLSNAFQDIAKAQAIIMAASFALLACALLTKLPIAACILFPLFTIHITTIPLPHHILADNLALSLTIIFAAFMIFYSSTKLKIFLFFSVLVSIYAFLLKPALLALSPIVGLVILYDFLRNIRNKKPAIILFTLGTLLSVGIIIYPAILSITSKIPTIGQLTYITKGMEVVAFAEKKDLKHLKSEDDKAILQIILKMRDEADAKYMKTYLPKGKENSSNILYFMQMCNPYGWTIFPKALRSVVGEPSNKIDYYHKASAFYNQLLPHLWEHRYKLYIASFLNSFGLYADDLIVSSVLQVYPYLHILLIILIFSSLIFGQKELNSSICVLSSIHILHMLATAMGHIIIPRYVEITEWSFLMAGFIACYSLLYKVISNILNRKIKYIGN